MAVTISLMSCIHCSGVQPLCSAGLVEEASSIELPPTDVSGYRPHTSALGSLSAPPARKSMRKAASLAWLGTSAPDTFSSWATSAAAGSPQDSPKFGEPGSNPSWLVVLPGPEAGTSSLSGMFAGCVQAASGLGDQVSGDMSVTVVVRSIP